MELPPNILDTLNCSHCGNHLSIFPINIYDNGDRICGRCEVQSSGTRRMVTYESVAAFVSFPCKNKKFGCTVATTPDKLVNHEGTCSYKQYDCFENCKWQGMLKSFRSHYEETHKDLVKTTDEYFKNEGKDCKVLLVYEDNVFLVQLNMKPVGFTADVYLLHGTHTSDQYMYELHFRLVSNEVVKLEKQEVKSISKFVEKAGTVVKGIDLINISDSCRINILNLSKVKSTLSQADLALAKKFMCKQCNRYRTSPYYQCPTGHPVCSTWLKKCGQYYCHLCSAYFKVVQQNSLLYDIATTIQCTCIYPGCNATFLITESIHHEKICRFKQFKCPFENCNFNHKINMIVNHLSDKHEGQFFINTMTSKLPKEQGENSVVIQNGSIFKVNICFQEKVLIIKVVSYGPQYMIPKPLFEVRMENLKECIYVKTSNYRKISLPEEMFIGDHSSWTYTFKFIE